jgi:hypothetical protein
MPGQGGTKPRITRDGGVPDAVDRRDRVTQRDGVQPAPPPGREHPRIHLQVHVAVRVAGREV